MNRIDLERSRISQDSPTWTDVGRSYSASWTLKCFLSKFWGLRFLVITERFSLHSGVACSKVIWQPRLMNVGTARFGLSEYILPFFSSS